jgi:hypothetical protein
MASVLTHQIEETGIRERRELTFNIPGFADTSHSYPQPSVPALTTAVRLKLYLATGIAAAVAG